MLTKSPLTVGSGEIGGQGLASDNPAGVSSLFWSFCFSFSPCLGSYSRIRDMYVLSLYDIAMFTLNDSSLICRATAPFAIKLSVFLNFCTIAIHHILHYRREEKKREKKKLTQGKFCALAYAICRTTGNSLVVGTRPCSRRWPCEAGMSHGRRRSLCQARKERDGRHQRCCVFHGGNNFCGVCRYV